MDKNYSITREQEIYDKWLNAGYFRADAASGKKPYTIMMPPPNITDRLHIGHALNATIQDILIRAKRMQGYEALWLPGTDHAAIATEVQVMKALAAKGESKETLGREEFLKRVWDWNELYGGTIISQIKKLGASCDWSRTRFTMDDALSDAVLTAFVQLYNEGHIYRGTRLVNWCVNCRTGISDAEVEHTDKDGMLWHFSYEVKNSHEKISFATTRPETMLGDTAIAVHPDDTRYKHLVGKTAIQTHTGREIPIIADDYVSPEFGTGVVKITPAHDPNDYEMGRRHSLPQVNILNQDGTINENGGTFAGLTRAEARTATTKFMADNGMFIKEEKISHAVGMHDRCGTTIEPMLGLQWFVKMEELAKPAIRAFQDGQVKFNEERFGKIYMHWLANIRDWCISRQLWWGHRIPAYYCPDGHITVAETAPATCATCGSHTLKQDDDVLDTWFSSALWPFSTLGWPADNADLQRFYPGDVLSTAQEIIFFWVVRMVFMGSKFMGAVPFRNVIIHGTVRDAEGRKMSKSTGNGIDPLTVIEEFGADALRLMLVSDGALASDMRFNREKLEHARNFLNKLWNATRFALMQDANNAAETQTEDNWILSRLNTLVQDVTANLDKHELGFVTRNIVDFVWDELCDWYVEMIKPRLKNGDAAAKNTLQIVLLTTVKLLHPVAPFITEDLFLALQQDSQTIMLAEWPIYQPALHNPTAEKQIAHFRDAVRAIRAVRIEKEVEPQQKIAVAITPADDSTRALFTHLTPAMALMAGAAQVQICDTPPGNAVAISLPTATIYLPMASLVDAEKERARLEKERARLEKEIQILDAKLNNPGFTAKAPPALVAAQREKRDTAAGTLQKILAQL